MNIRILTKSIQENSENKK